MLSEQTVAIIEQLQSRYPIKRGALLMALHAAQEEKGFLTKSDFAEIGDLFNLDPAEVESVSSFYTMFYTKPQGKCLFQMCTNVSCMVDGAYAVLEHLRTTLGIAPGQVTEDGLFGLMEVECLAACDTAPCLQISDREFFPRVTIEQIDRIIEHYRMGGSHPAPGAEVNPLAWTGSVDFEPLAPLTPAEIKPRPGAEPPKSAAQPAAGSPPGAPSAPKPATKSTPTIAIKTADAPLTSTELKAEAEAYARIEAAIKAREEEKQAAIRAEEDRLAKRAAQQAAWRAEAEEADAKKLAEVEIIERAKYREATKLIIVRPPEPEPEPEPEEEAPEADLSALHEGMHLGGAAPALSATSSWEQPKEVVPEAEPEPVPPPEPQLNLETSADLPTWEPSNPYLRYLAQPAEDDQGDAPKEGTDA